MQNDLSDTPYSVGAMALYSGVFLNYCLNQSGKSEISKPLVRTEGRQAASSRHLHVRERQTDGKWLPKEIKVTEDGALVGLWQPQAIDCTANRGFKTAGSPFCS